MWHVIMNKIIYSLWLCLLLCACAPTAQQVDYSVTYDMSGTKYTQVFMVTTEELLEDLNSNLENYGLELTEMIIGSNRTGYSENGGDTWKILPDCVEEFEVKTSSSLKDFLGCVEEIELSLFASDDADAERNGEYIRALIKTFTPGAEDLVEETLGIYGEPMSKAVVTEGVQQYTFSGVQYSYIQGTSSNSGKFIICPDIIISEDSQQSVIKPIN